MEKTLRDQVYELLATVPRGKVTTYGEIARAAGTSGYRAVGQILNQNPNAPVVPCHRVVMSDGKLGGYAFGVTKKVALLSSEGVPVKKGKVKDFKRYLHVFKSARSKVR